MKFLFAILFLVSPSWAINLSTIRNDCRINILDTGSSRQRFSDAQLNRFINEGQKRINYLTWPVRKSKQFELVSGTTYYSMPSDFIHPERVTRDYQVLPEKSIRNLDKNQQWEEVSGLPINYYIHFASRTKMGFYPFPDSSSSTGTIRMDYIAQPTDLSSDSDTPFNGITELQPYGYSLSLFCSYRASVVDQQFNTAQAFFQEFQADVQRISEDAVARPNYRPSASGSGQ